MIPKNGKAGSVASPSLALLTDNEVVTITVINVIHNPLSSLSTSGSTALVATVLHCQDEALRSRLLRLLLDAGADPNVGDDHGTTPLMHAASTNAPDVVITLLQHVSFWNLSVPAFTPRNRCASLKNHVNYSGCISLMRNDDKHTHARTQALTQTSAWTLARVQFFDPQHFVAKVLSRVGQRGLRYHVWQLLHYLLSIPLKRSILNHMEEQSE